MTRGRTSSGSASTSWSSSSSFDEAPRTRSRATSCWRRSGACSPTRRAARSTTSSSSCADKLEEDHKNPKHILTVYGFGYKLVP